ncbi:MAG TPA: SGNH/GDSL hydrolase family protein [Bdellovibrionales bacterium]|nr:SGNH/GDSL hydrolase family protein [Bdellovibrionales bacterium]
MWFRIPRDGAIVLFITVCLLAAGEWIARLTIFRDPEHFASVTARYYSVVHRQPIMPATFDLDSELLWRMKPHQDAVRFERETGTTWLFQTDLKGRRIEAATTAGVGSELFEIATLGDSCTLALESSISYSGALARILQNRHPERKVTLTNLGVSGYSILQGHRAFKKYLEDGGRPQLVLIHGGHNDSNGPFLGKLDRELTILTMYRLRLRDMLKSSRLAVALFHALAPGSGHGTENGARVPADEFEAHLREIIAAVRERGGKVVLIPPTMAKSAPGWIPEYDRGESLIGHNEYTRVMYKLAAETGSIYVDTTSVARGLGDRRFFHDIDGGDNIHPGLSGHAALGAAIAAKLEADGF